jgi:hypothetical protein
MFAVAAQLHWSIAAHVRPSGVDSPLAAQEAGAHPPDEVSQRAARAASPEVTVAPSVSTPPGSEAELARGSARPPHASAATGLMASGAALAMTESDQPAGTGAEASGTAGKSVARRDARPPRHGGAPPPPPEKARETPAGSEQSAATSAGSAAGLCRSPVQQGWPPQRDTTVSEPQTAETDEPTTDESRTSAQRGGVQPTLKDRQEPPSRELGISGDQGLPGAGRGGPTPPKKSRGTASLVLGVPVPDFVRGRMGPGPTKVTRERVPPVAAPGEAAARIDATERVGMEAAQPRSDILPGFAARVRDYLITLHSLATLADSAGNSPEKQLPEKTQ